MPFVVFGIFLLIALAMMVVGLVAANRRAANLMALSTMARTVGSGRPLAEELAEQADAARGSMSRLLQLAANDLSTGLPLSQVLFHRRIVPRGCWLEAAGALSSGRLPEALRIAAARETARFSVSSAPTTPRLLIAYWGWMFTVMFLIVAFIMYFIIPKFKKIFEDFNSELPNATQALIAVADTGISWMVWPLIPAVLIGSLMLEAYAEYCGWAELLERFFGPYWVRLRAPDLLRGLRWGVSAGEPLDKVLLAMAEAPLPMAYRSRLNHAAMRLQRGEEPWAILHTQGWLTSAEAELLRSAQQNDHLPWALNALSDSTEATREFKLAAFAECAHPVMLIVAGVIVGCLVYAFFIPLIKLIYDMA
jgi:type IV pilus assembly protein PilC